MAAVQQQQLATASATSGVKISSVGSSGARPLQMMPNTVVDGPSISSPPVDQRPSAVTVVNMQQSSITISSGTSTAQSPTKQIPPPLQLGISTPAAVTSPTPTNVVLIRPAPVLSPTSRNAPGGGFFIHTGTSSAAAPAAVPVANGPASIQPSFTVVASSPLVIQPRPVVQSAAPAGAVRGSPVIVVPQEAVRTSFNVVSSAAPTQAPLPANVQAAAGFLPRSTAIVEPVEFPDETITTLVKTSEVLKTNAADVAVSIIRPPAAPKPERKGPPPPTPSELIASADIFWVCGFALAVMAVAFLAMANDEDLPTTYVLSGVVFASLAAFVKLRL